MNIYVSHLSWGTSSDISNPKGVKSPRDPKVRETILAIVEEFFAKNNAAFLYICDTSVFQP